MSFDFLDCNKADKKLSLSKKSGARLKVSY